jgi:hypothetical protein
LTQKGQGYSGGSVPEFDGVPYYAPAEHLNIMGAL